MHPPLAYCSNCHPGEGLDEIAAVLDHHSRAVRERLGWDELGIDLRLGSRAVADFALEPAALERLRRVCDDARLRPFTINGFPLAPFQEGVVKEGVYAPDWTEEPRLADSLGLLRIAAVLGDGEPMTISTLPGSYKPWHRGRDVEPAIAANLGTWAAAAWKLARAGGSPVSLAIEPEPLCTWETADELAAFFRGPLVRDGLDAATRALDGDRAGAAAALEGHLGTCVDTCHASVEFEDQRAAVATLVEAGAPPVKCQFSAAPQVIEPGLRPAAVAELRAMAEPRFLHQTVAKGPSGIVRVADLDRLDECLARCVDAVAVRSHFHIPVDGDPGGELTSTVADSLEGLGACREAGCTHIGVETYTWSVLAEEPGDVVEGTARELAWLAERCAAEG